MGNTKKPTSKKSSGSAKKPAASKRATGAKSVRRSVRTTAKGGRFRIKDPKKLIRLIPLIAIPALLVVMLVLINKAKLKETFSLPSLSALTQSKTPAATDTVIEGVSVKGLSREDATALVKSEAALLLADIDMLVGEGENELRLTAAYIQAETDMDAVLAEVYDQGASGTFALTVTADSAVLAERLAEIADTLGEAPVEPYAEVRLNENNVQRFDIHEGKSGTVLDVDATVAAIQAALAGRDLQARITPVMKAQAPTMSAAYIKENTKRIATYTTRFRDSESVETIANRVFNINKATDIINCATVAPGDEWSFNDYVGLRTVEDGWKEANGIDGGKEYTLQAGGGICQVSTTLYNALLRANIQVTDRKAHSIPSDYVDKGLDATVDSGGIDLKFVNDTGAPLYLFAYVKGDPDNSRYSTITVSLYGKPLPDGVSYELRSEVVDVNERTDTRFTYSDKVPEGYELPTVTRHDGYTAEVYRDKYENGEKVDSTLLYTDKYRGNVAEITIGTGGAGTPVPTGAVKSGSTANEAG